jgi:hypothetical protein
MQGIKNLFLQIKVAYIQSLLRVGFDTIDFLVALFLPETVPNARYSRVYLS